jgi:hypothetical protein
LACALAVLLATTGCGIAASSSPEVVEHGQGLGQGQQGPNDSLLPGEPSTFTDPAALIKGFLSAAVGGNDAGEARATAFLSKKARDAFLKNQPDQPNGELTVIRLVGEPQKKADADGRVPFDVNYQTIGKLTTNGRLTKLIEPGDTPDQMKFFVRNAARQYEIDEIQGGPPGLLLLDSALSTYYTIQPIYFWDTSWTTLVPDLRYIPNSTPAAPRANNLVNWLRDGPSALLNGGVQRLLPTTQLTEPVSKVGDVLQVKLNAQAIPSDDKTKADAIKRLAYQLQWTLSTGSDLPDIDLYIGNEKYPITGDYGAFPFNGETSLPTSTPQVYDIVAGKVRPNGIADTQLPQLFTGTLNAGVSSAAISRDGQAAAFVTNGGKNLTFVRSDGKPVAPSVRFSNEIGRPIWVPGKDAVYVLVISGSQLYSVSSVDGSKVEITPRPGGKVQSVSISPDGRRIALVTTGGDLEVAQIGIEDSVKIEPDPQVITFDPAFTATGAAWTDRAWLYVVGKNRIGGQPRYYKVTADGAVAIGKDLLVDIDPTGIVAFPTGGQYAFTDVFVLTAKGAYSLGGGQPGYTNPFFVN